MGGNLLLFFNFNLDLSDIMATRRMLILIIF